MIIDHVTQREYQENTGFRETAPLKQHFKEAIQQLGNNAAIVATAALFEAIGLEDELIANCAPQVGVVAAGFIGELFDEIFDQSVSASPWL